MKIKLIWKKLILENKEFTTKEELIPLCEQIEKDPTTVVNYLSVHGYIHRIFNGLYYIKTPNELETGAMGKNIYELVADGMRYKGLKKWYFGLETALKMNNVTHEYFSVNYVISDDFRTTKVVKIIDSEFQFLKWSGKMFGFGLIKKNGFKHSDLEKTILDIIYKRYWRGTKENQLVAPYIEYENNLNKKKIDEYLEHYPKVMGVIVRRQYERVY